MTADSKKAITLLGELYLLPLDKCIPEDEADIMSETFKRSEEEKHFYVGLVKELKLKFKELEQWIQKYVTSIN